MMSRRSLLAVAALGITSALAFGSFGCGSDSSLGPSANAVSRVRTINALSGASANVVILQTATGQTITPITGLAFATATDYSTIRAGNGIIFQGVLGGTTQALTQTASFDLSSHNNGNNDNSGTYTLGIVGTANQAANQPDVPHLFRVLDNFPGSIATNTIALRLINLSPDAGAVGLYNTSGGSATALTGLTNIAFDSNATVSGSGYQTVAFTSGQTLNLSVRNNAGTVLPTVTSLSAFARTPGGAYTLYVVGSVNPSTASGRQPLNVVVTTDYTP